MLDPGVVDFVRKFDLVTADRLVLMPAGTTGTPTRLTWERIR
jgi:hypothetical protein